jgi:hypothetical protein
MKLSTRTCAQCGAQFEPTKSWQSFCQLACQQRFADIDAIRGKVAMPFMLAWRTGKRGRTENSAYALAQLAELADRWQAEDRLTGRDAMRIVSRKRKDGWRAADLCR